jgi:hypothetical protein
VTISTADDLGLTVVSKTYDVRFLLNEGLDARTRDKQLVALSKLIKGSIAPASWTDHEGKLCTLMELKGDLIIVQTPQNQTLVDNLVTQLRTLTQQAKH